MRSLAEKYWLKSWRKLGKPGKTGGIERNRICMEIQLFYNFEIYGLFYNFEIAFKC
jgi:hypothetical protein